MLMIKERSLIVEYGKKIVSSGLTKGTGGNLSICNRKRRLIAISPSGIDYLGTKPQDIVILNLQGEIIDGDKKPSSELQMHRVFYEKRKDIDAIIHTHTVYATILSCLQWKLPAVHYLLASAGKDIRCADYATFGTEKLARNAFEAMKGRKAVLLANHGLLAGSIDLADAFSITEDVEYCAELYYRSKSIGDPVILNDKEMNLMVERFKNYGQ